MAKDTNKTAVTDIAATLASADLEELDKALEDRREQIKKLEGEIYSLKLVRRSVEAFKNGRPERKTGPRKKKGEASSPSAPPTPTPHDGLEPPVVRIKRFLDKIGAGGVPAIARGTRLTADDTAATLRERSDVFVSKPGGLWKLR